MRNNSTLEALFPTTRQGILTATLAQPDKWWFLSELAHSLGTSPSSLQRELSALVDAGILEKRREGSRVYFKPHQRSPIYPELRGIFEKTAGIVPTVQAALATFSEKIACAFIYGSIARSTEHAASDVDLMVIGRVGLADLSPALRKIERRLAREVNVTLYSALDFRLKLAHHDHFLTSVLKRPKQFVKGSQRELDKIAGK